jgi:hypothetical protein
MKIEHCNYSCYRIRDPLTLVTSKLNASISRDCRQYIIEALQYNKSSQKKDIDILPIDDKTINDIHNMSKYCRNIFDVIFDNHRAFLEEKQLH